MSVRTWDLFCRVIDNHGDIGVCWRLAAELAARGELVRLWVDDASALAWMAPSGTAEVSVRPFDASALEVEPGSVVIEAFGCNPPAAFVERMATLSIAPLWINLEYLSAEDFVERSHGLASPQMTGPGAGLLKWFFYPGFTPATGGLIREPGLLARREEFDGDAWLASLGADHQIDLARRDGERVVSLFCYEQPALRALLAALSERPTLLLVTPGHAARQVKALLGASFRQGQLRAVELPPLTQVDYDHLLWASDLNFVRGEDSFVRAQWAGAPFVWQIYPQDDGVHLVKLSAFMQLQADHASELAAPIERLWNAWNQGDADIAIELPPLAEWRRLSVGWRETLLAQPDLVTSLLRFADEKRPERG